MSKFSPGGGGFENFVFAAVVTKWLCCAKNSTTPRLPKCGQALPAIDSKWSIQTAAGEPKCWMLLKKKPKIWNLDVLVDSNQVFLGRGVIFELGQSHTPNPSWDIELDMLGLYCLFFSQLFERTLQHHLVKLSKYELQHLHYRWTFVNQVLGSLSMFIPVCIYSIHLSWPCRISSMNTTTTRYHHKLF